MTSQVGSTLRKRGLTHACLPTSPQCLSSGKLLGQGSFSGRGRCEPLVVKRICVDTFCIHYGYIKDLSVRMLIAEMI